MFQQIIAIFCVLITSIKSIPIDINDRIVGGSNAIKNSAPYIVTIQYSIFPGVIPSRHFCGGAIISKKWVISAGHCFTQFRDYNNIIVMGGKYNLSSIDINNVNVQKRNVDRIFIHDNYDGLVGPYDISLILLRSPFIMTNKVNAIQLPLANAIPTGIAELYGWGNISPNGYEMPNVLQFINVPIVENDDCESVLEEDIELFHETNLCTGPLNGSLSACNGDSGGPLVQFNSNNKAEIIGIVSWGFVPCGNGAPSIYVRVSAFIDWIDNILNEYK